MAKIIAERLRQVIRYDPDDGRFWWLVTLSVRRLAGNEAGSVSKALGYRLIGIDGTTYYAHRLAWLYVTGVWPKRIDHKNGNRFDNKFDNLREATGSQNIANSRRHITSSTGFKGVHFASSTLTRPWRSKIKVRGEVFHLGYFATAQEAHAAYCAAAKKFHGEFARFA